ncbi:MAG: MerR family transcriptional regulator [Chloroflexi bacterium]|nr:MerR family transcriptional regulator [Chloroflexota bacterium]
MIEPAPSYTIKIVSERTGVPLHTLRAWERRYGVPKPGRGADNRYRFYDDDDIADVLWLKRQVDSGVSPSQASALRCRQKAQAETRQATPALQSLSDRRHALQDALLTFDDRAAHQILDEAMGLFPLEQVAAQVIVPAMHGIGEQWMRNEIGIGQEHFASNLLRQRLLTALQVQPPLSSAAPLLIAACAPEEQHELGLLIFTLLARRQGWRVTYLGARTPLHDLVKVGQVSAPRGIVVSVTTVIGLANLIPLLGEGEQPAAPIYFGGGLFEALPRLSETIPGAYIGADAGLALQALAREPQAHAFKTSRRALAAAHAVRNLRMELAAHTASALSVQHTRPGSEFAGIITFATLFLTDALACALAFDLPELMDAQAHWLRQALTPRAVTTAMIIEHLSAFERAAYAVLGRNVAAQVRALVARMKDSAAYNAGQAQSAAASPSR